MPDTTKRKATKTLYDILEEKKAVYEKYWATVRIMASIHYYLIQLPLWT